MNYANCLDPKLIFATLTGFFVLVIEEFITNIVEGVGTDMILWSADHIEQSGYQYGTLCAFIIRLIPAVIAGAGAYTFCSNH